MLLSTLQTLQDTCTRAVPVLLEHLHLWHSGLFWWDSQRLAQSKFSLPQLMGSETCVRPGLEGWNIEEGLKEVWKPLTMEAWNVLTPSRVQGLFLQPVPGGMTFPISFSQKEPRHTETHLYSGRRRDEALALTHSQMGSKWRSTGEICTPRGSEALMLHWVLAQLHQLLHQGDSKGPPAALVAAGPSSEALHLGTVPLPTGKEQKCPTEPRAACSSMALAIALVSICCCQSRTVGFVLLAEMLPTFYEIAASWPQESVMQRFGSMGEPQMSVNSSSSPLAYQHIVQVGELEQENGSERIA